MGQFIMCAGLQEVTLMVPPLIVTLAESHKHLGISDSFKTHLTQKLKIKLFSKGYLSSSNCKTIVRSTFTSVLDYGGIVYCHAAPSILLQCVSQVGWTSSQSRRNSHLMLLIYKSPLFKLPNLTSLLSFKTSHYSTRFQ